MGEIEYKNEIVELGKSLFQRGYATGSSGNLSVLMEDGRYIATPTGSSLGFLKADELSVLSSEGELLSGKAPSKEIRFHLAIYQKKPKNKAIVHLHSTYLTALSCIKNIDVKNAIKAFTPYYIMRIGKLPMIPYYRPGDERLCDELANAAMHHTAILMANHGVVVCGNNLFEAVNSAEELEETAKLYFILQDKKINYLTDEQIDNLDLHFKKE
ncbi:aldolase [Vibrio parahaemolyticus]|nr:aldolase [Vibrio parahaemolyticus]